MLTIVDSTTSTTPASTAREEMTPSKVRRLSGAPQGLPPASPAGNDMEEDGHGIRFLLGAYARYKTPYVWRRSDSLKLEALGIATAKDQPLQLETTENWDGGNYRVWNIIAELVQLCLLRSRKNPFQVDFSSLESLESSEKQALLGAMAGFLKEIIGSPSAHLYYQQVEDDLRRVLKMLYSEVRRGS